MNSKCQKGLIIFTRFKFSHRQVSGRKRFSEKMEVVIIWLKFLLFILAWISSHYTAGADMFPMSGQQQFSGTDKTGDVFGLDNEEIFPVAYFDINADKWTDVIAVSRDRTEIQIFLAFDNPPFLRRTLVNSPKIVNEVGDKRVIISVRPGDFTGNGRADLMITLAEEKHIHNETAQGVDLVFCFMKFDYLKYHVDLECGGPGTGGALKGLVQEPSVLDLNGDMVLDLLGEQYHTEDMKQRRIWLSRNTKDSFEWSYEEFRVIGPLKNETLREMSCTSSNAFADIDGDNNPELIVLTEDRDVTRDKSSYYLETFEIVKDRQERVTFQFTKPPEHVTTSPANETKVIGQPLIVDFEHNGKLSHLLPFCRDLNCEHFGIYVMREGGIAAPLPIDSFEYEGASWSFISPPRSQINPSNSTNSKRKPTPDHPKFPMESFYSQTVSLRLGDYNLDGYPDLLGVMKNNLGYPNRTTRAILFENVKCTSTPSKPCLFERTFSPNFEMFKDYTNVISASFYDIGDNGALDVILVKQHHQDIAAQQQSFVARALQNEMNFDASFLKVMVLTGQGCLECENGIPYGNVLPGATIKYTSHNTRGIAVSGVMTQTFRTSHMPLDLPCGIFGIGQSPNFIDTLTVAVAPNAEKSFKRDWLQLIPNSQVVVVPNPLESPGRWIMKLYLTPSDAVLKTFGVLVGICLLLGTLAGAFEFKERREDRLKRQGEAHRLVM